MSRWPSPSSGSESASRSHRDGESSPGVSRCSTGVASSVGQLRSSPRPSSAFPTAPCHGGTQIIADRSPISADRPLGLAPRTEALPSTPKEFFFLGTASISCSVRGGVLHTETRQGAKPSRRAKGSGEPEPFQDSRGVARYLYSISIAPPSYCMPNFRFACSMV